ncbi:DHS-like NAD/FAD-binding domain-containing protein [Irpex rosettiformis]|uniref:DHS-like NAD/FAD-binding domain-containing protein n=1 Tax=Irpex rosettiformis TaxID=378272 RepID=A0ACB8TQ06_9APHY|nr:DHS-like NAD/FAD-binding domain-containing protein [Irpex rosettiformis]
MTVFIPLDVSAPLPPSPHFLVQSTEPTAHVQKVIKAILKAKRIAILCGAGISVKAGIPDFRSETGLFQTLKKDHSSLSSGKDLFDASVFNSEATTALFCKMIAGLAELAQTAQPTAFHHMLRALDDKGRLLRVYTQNIDALEQKAGLTFGVPELDVRRSKPRSSKGVSDSEIAVPGSSANTADRLPTPPAETPRCIPLHGTLQSMHCQICLHSFPLEQHIGSLSSGTFPICPDCSQTDETRQAVGKRSRGVGKLRPSVVLYNEMHKDGEEVGGVVARDLVGSSKGKGRAGADLLIVVGTSLRVPGTKRMVREFSKALHSRNSTTTSSQGESSTSGASLGAEDDHPVKTIYLNLDFPVPTREWEGVFDVWLRGDAQYFARLVQEEMAKEEQAREAAQERKRRREEMKAEAEAAKREEERLLAEAQAKGKQKGKASGKGKLKGKVQVKAPGGLAPSKKRKAGDEKPIKKPLSSKRRKVSPPTPETSAQESDEDPSGSLASMVQKFFIRIPPMTASKHPKTYIPLTPPSSQSHAASRFSSPLSSPPDSNISTPGELLSGCSSPLTQLSSSPSVEPVSYLSTPPNLAPPLDLNTTPRSRKRSRPSTPDLGINDSPATSLSFFNLTSQLSSPPPTPPQLSLGLSSSVSRRRPTVLQAASAPPPSYTRETLPSLSYDYEESDHESSTGQVQYMESFVRDTF